MYSEGRREKNNKELFGGSRIRNSFDNLSNVKTDVSMLPSRRWVFTCTYTQDNVQLSIVWSNTTKQEKEKARDQASYAVVTHNIPRSLSLAIPLDSRQILCHSNATAHDNAQWLWTFYFSFPQLLVCHPQEHEVGIKTSLGWTNKNHTHTNNQKFPSPNHNDSC